MIVPALEVIATPVIVNATNSNAKGCFKGVTVKVHVTKMKIALAPESYKCAEKKSVNVVKIVASRVKNFSLL
jgi:alpha-D-ribose 1-methylphosphonate 5-triphosphate synthase subunit PhnL